LWSIQLIDSSKPKLVQATPGWGGWGGDGVKEWERAKKVLQVSHKKTKQEKLNALMNADVDPSKVSAHHCILLNA
jgi:U3 small nucleolar RNA-associated protein 14